MSTKKSTSSAKTSSTKSTPSAKSSVAKKAPSKSSVKPAAEAAKAVPAPKPEKAAAPAVESYVLKSQVHFGSLKTSVPKGTLVVVDRQAGKAVINGAEHDNLAEIDMMIRAGFIVPGKRENVVEPRTRHAGQSSEKLEVVQSDQDLMEEDIDISNTRKAVRDQARREARKETMEVIHEESGASSRGLEVVASEKKMGVRKADTEEEVLSVVNGDNAVVRGIPRPSRPKGVPASSLGVPDSSGDASLVNGDIEAQGRVVKSIGSGKAETRSVSSGSKLVAKHSGGTAEAREKAKAAAEARKAALAAKHAEDQKQG